MLLMTWLETQRRAGSWAMVLASATIHNREHPIRRSQQHPPIPPTSLPEIPSRPLSRTDSLPSYHSDTQTEPPSYESDVDMSEIVVDGYRTYRSSSTSEVSSHWTPDSSVIDVSPRPSADTLRYPQSIFTLDEEESDAD